MTTEEPDRYMVELERITNILHDNPKPHILQALTNIAEGNADMIQQDHMTLVDVLEMMMSEIAAETTVIVPQRLAGNMLQLFHIGAALRRRKPIPLIDLNLELNFGEEE